MRLESVSKRWQKYVFVKQMFIEITDDSDYNENSLALIGGTDQRCNIKALESVLKKCPNISHVIVKNYGNVESRVLSLIGRHCNHIKSLEFDIREVCDYDYTPFFTEYGHKLTELNVNGSEYSDRIICQTLS